MLDSRYHHRRHRHHRCCRHHRYPYRHQQAIAKKHQPKPLQEMLQKISGNRCNNKKTPLLQETPGTHCKKHHCCKKHRGPIAKKPLWKSLVRAGKTLLSGNTLLQKKHQSRKKKSRENQVEFKTSNRVLTASAPAAFAALRCLGSPSGHDMRSISNCSNLL